MFAPRKLLVSPRARSASVGQMKMKGRIVKKVRRRMKEKMGGIKCGMGNLDFNFNDFCFNNYDRGMDVSRNIYISEARLNINFGFSNSLCSIIFILF